MTKAIPLTQGYEAIIDDKDYERVSKYGWRAEVKSNTVYATRTFINKTAELHDTRMKPYYSNMYMHRFILDVKKGKQVDHLDGNGLNNTRKNIRILSQSMNNAKRKSKGIFTGVKKRTSGRYRADIRRNGEAKCLGTFDTVEKAIEARKKAEIEWYGPSLRMETELDN